MSIQAVAAVLDHSEARKSARLVAISIANHVDKNGVGWLSVRLAGEEALIASKTTVIEAIKQLRGLGELVVLVPEEGKTHRPPLYWLNLPGLSGACGDDHPYFQAYGPRSEIAPYPGTENGPGPGTDSGPGPDQKMDPPRSKVCTHPGTKTGAGPYREPSKSQKQQPDDNKSSSGNLSNLLADLIAGNDPNGKRPTVTKAWLNAERLLLDRDEREYDMAERLIRWCQADDFWKANVLSMPTFRQKYGTLFLQAGRQKIKPGSSAGEHPADRRIRELDEEDGTIDGTAEEAP